MMDKKAEDQITYNTENKKMEREITQRFVMLVSLDIGPGKRWRYKIDFCKDMGIKFQAFDRMEKLNRHLQFGHLVKYHELTGADLNFIILGKNVNPKNKQAIAMLQEVIKTLK